MRCRFAFRRHDAALFIELRRAPPASPYGVWAEAERHHHRVGVDNVFGTRYLLAA